MAAITSATKMAGFRNARRVQEALTANVERKALLWLAHRTPSWVTPDHLTTLGFLGQLAAGLCYVWARWHTWGLALASVAIAVNWLGDSLDGTLARFRGRLRPRFGFYVDHMADTFGAAALMLGLAASGYLHWQVAIAMLVAFLVLSVETYLAAYTVADFRLSRGIFGPTEIRILLMAANTGLIFSTRAGGRVFWLDVGGAIAAAGMLGMSIFAAARNTAWLYREERV